MELEWNGGPPSVTLVSVIQRELQLRVFPKGTQKTVTNLLLILLKKLLLQNKETLPPSAMLRRPIWGSADGLEELRPLLTRRILKEAPYICLQQNSSPGFTLIAPQTNEKRQSRNNFKRGTLYSANGVFFPMSLGGLANDAYPVVPSFRSSFLSFFKH